jgi:hypothetical protein
MSFILRCVNVLWFLLYGMRAEMSRHLLRAFSLHPGYDQPLLPLCVIFISVVPLR